MITYYGYSTEPDTCSHSVSTTSTLEMYSEASTCSTYSSEHYRNCTLPTITIIGSYNGDRREDGKDGGRGTGQVTRGDRWKNIGGIL